MSNKKQTAVEWLLNNMPDLGRYIPFGVSMELHAKFQQAKEMEKEQIIEHHTLLLSGVMGEISAREDAENYFEETYGE